MSEIINNSEGSSNSNIMRELSGIKSSLAVQTSETVNIKESIAEIKVDIKEIKTGYITADQHRTLTDCTEDHESRLRTVETNITRILTWGTAFVVLAGIVEFLIQKFY